MVNWIAFFLMFVCPHLFASPAPSVLPDGAYTTNCTTSRAEKFDNPSDSSTLPSQYVLGQTDKMGISRSSSSRSGITTFRTVDDTTLVTEDYQSSLSYKNPNDATKTSTQINQENSISTLVIKPLNGGLFEETGSVTTRWLFSLGDGSKSETGIDSSKWRRTFEIFDNNLEINVTSQKNDKPEVPSHYEAQVTNNKGVFMVTYYNREPFRDDPKAWGDEHRLGGLILQNRTVCTYKPVEQSKDQKDSQ